MREDAFHVACATFFYASVFAATRPALLLAACQLIDTLLAVLPDDFSAFSWMFVPGSSPDGGFQQAVAKPSGSTPPSGRGTVSDDGLAAASGTEAVGFAALLAPLCHVESAQEGRPTGSELTGLLRPSPDGKRRPLLGMCTLQHASDLSPFALQLAKHLARSALHSRAAELDVSMAQACVITTRNADSKRPISHIRGYPCANTLLLLLSDGYD